MARPIFHWLFHISMFFFKVTFCGKNLQNHVFVDIIMSNLIVSRPWCFCHLWVCSLEVLNQFKYQKQLVASRKQKYFCAWSCPKDAKQGVQIGPEARLGHLPGVKIIGNPIFFDNFVDVIISNVIVLRPLCFCHLWVCSLEVLNQVRYQKQLVASRKQNIFLCLELPGDEWVRILQKPAAVPVLSGWKSPEFHDFQ